jgi:hypothetical protein
MSIRHHLPAGVLALLLQPGVPAMADPRPDAALSVFEGCEKVVVTKEGAAAVCERCKPGYHLSSTKTCLWLGDFGSPEDEILRDMPRR